MLPGKRASEPASSMNQPARYSITSALDDLTCESVDWFRRLVDISSKCGQGSPGKKNQPLA